MSRKAWQRHRVAVARASPGAGEPPQRSRERVIVGLLLFVWLGLFAMASAWRGTSERAVAGGPLTETPSTTRRGPEPTNVDPNLYQQLGLPAPSELTGMPSVRPIAPRAPAQGLPSTGTTGPLPSSSEPWTEPLLVSPPVSTAASGTTIASAQQHVHVDVSRVEEQNPAPVTTPGSSPTTGAAAVAPAVESAQAGVPPSTGPLPVTGGGWAVLLTIVGVALLVAGCTLVAAARLRSIRSSRRA